MKIVLAVLPYLLLGTIEIAPLLGRGRRAESVAVGGITILGAIYAAGAVGDWTLPNPVQLLTWFFYPISSLLGAL